MCKILLAYGGTDLLNVKDLKSRDPQHFATQHGLDLRQIMRHGLRIDCWNFSVLNELEKSNRILQATEKSTTGSTMMNTSTMSVGAGLKESKTSVDGTTSDLGGTTTEEEGGSNRSNHGSKETLGAKEGTTSGGKEGTGAKDATTVTTGAKKGSPVKGGVTGAKK